MTVATGPQARGRRIVLASAVVLALLALGGCKGVSDSTTYPELPIVPPPPYFYAIGGNGPDDVYVVGQPGLIYHFDGTAWARQNSPTGVALTSVFVDPESHVVYITGHDGVIMRSIGDGNWTFMATGTGENLYDVGTFLRVLPESETQYIIAVGHAGTILRFVDGGWQPAPGNIMVRNNINAPADTLTTGREMVSATCVFTYGVGGAYLDERPLIGGVKGCVLLNDPDLDWQLRPIANGEGWVTASVGGAFIPDNFVGTDKGRLFRMTELQDGIETFVEMYSPALGEVVYGLWTDPQNTVYAVSNAGRISRVTGNNEFLELYYDGLTLFDVWGTSSVDFYAVGIGGRILHFFDPAGGDNPQWVQEEVELPAGKAYGSLGLDKFGRRF